MLLRVEDLDGPRIKPEAVAGIQATLAWLGMDWDGPVMRQSEDLEPYRAAMRKLAAGGWVYPSGMSRSEIESAASAPQQGSGEVAFPASMRPEGAGRPRPFEGEEQSWRLATPAGEVVVEDRFAGVRRMDPSSTIGDFIVWTKRGTPAYQLAVVVDDARQGVTEVIRGDDLLDSAARQMRLYEALALGSPPRYTHVPLVVGPDGRRLAKRHGDTRVDQYRAAGVDPRAVIGWVARTCGLAAERISAEELSRGLRLDMIPATAIAFGPEDDAWLRSQRVR